MPSSHRLVLPDLISTCPFNSSLNLDYERARGESNAWVDRFGALAGRKGAIFSVYNLELLISLAHPEAGYEELKTCCDWNNLFFVYDEISDQLGGEEVLRLADEFLKALDGEFTRDSVISDMTKE